MAQRRFKTITGYFLRDEDVVLNLNEEEDEEEKDVDEEEIQPEFLDMEEMNSVSYGGQLFKSSVPASKQVFIKSGKKKYRVEGHFHLRDPWWNVTCTVRRGKKGKYFSPRSSNLSYSLRTGLRSESRSLVSLFLNECLPDSDFVTKFMKWLPENRHVELVNVLDVLEEFGDSSPEKKAEAEQLKSGVSNSVAWKRVEVARKYPQIMKYLPTLLPGHFLAIISDGKKKNTQDNSKQMSNTKLLDELEDIIKNDVWKLGFYLIMFKELHMIRCEAKLEAFKLCNLLERITNEQHDALKLYAQLKEYFRKTGSTYIDKKIFLQNMEKWNITYEACLFLQTHGVLVKENSMVALHNYFSYEKGIAESLEVLVKRDWNIQLDVKEVLRKAHSDIAYSAMELDPDHVRAAEMMCANPMTVVSGKGGCGKTTVVSRVFKAVMQKLTGNCKKGENPPVLLTAPIGRAASVLTKKSGFTAYTMHQVLWSFMNAKKDLSGNPENWKFSQVRVLVVDEGSLVSVQILESLLRILTKHALLQKFIILGDVRQLPSIEPGNTLYDLFEGLRNVRWAIEMQTNHRAESELIVRNAALISEMGKKRHYRRLEFDATIDMTKPSTAPFDKRFIFVQIKDVNDVALRETIEFLLKNAPGLEDHKSSQIVAFLRKDCELINSICCEHYSGHPSKTDGNKTVFQTKDKVCCTKNGYLGKDDEQKQEKPEYDDTQDDHRSQIKKEHKKERMHNGEIFFITADVTYVDTGVRPKIRRYLTLDDGNGHVVTSTYGELQRECKLRHAWAKTIHTFQGSEAETIVYVLGNCFVENWQHVYSAVTRGQKRVYVVGRERALEAAIKKWTIPRNTRLCGRVRVVVTPAASKRSAQSDPCITPDKRKK